MSEENELAKKMFAKGYNYRLTFGLSKTLIPDDGFADGGEPYTDEEMDIMHRVPDPLFIKSADDAGPLLRTTYPHNTIEKVEKIDANGFVTE